MSFVLGAMFLVSAGIGIALVVVAWKWARARRRASARSIVIDGAVIGVERKEMRSQYTAKARRRRRSEPTRYAFHPRIAFTTPSGERREFVAPSGEIGERSPFVIGSTIRVRFDPENEAPPAVDSLAGLWGPSIAAGCGGLVFTAVSIGLGGLFYAKVIAS